MDGLRAIIREYKHSGLSITLVQGDGEFTVDRKTHQLWYAVRVGVKWEENPLSIAEKPLGTTHTQDPL
jgi:hypothetical protein